MVMHIVAKSSTCVAAKIADLVVARAGVGDSFGAVWEHQDAAAGSLALDAGQWGHLSFGCAVNIFATLSTQYLGLQYLPNGAYFLVSECCGDPNEYVKNNTKLLELTWQ